MLTWKNVHLTCICVHVKCDLFFVFFSPPQLRVHTTVDCVFYLHVTSKAIIEDCRKLQFAPYSLSYPKLQAQFQVREQCSWYHVCELYRLHLQESGLNESVNNWDSVDDFNWLVPSTPSPNWTLLPQEQIKTWKCD